MRARTIRLSWPEVANLVVAIAFSMSYIAAFVGLPNYFEILVTSDDFRYGPVITSFRDALIYILPLLQMLISVGLLTYRALARRRKNPPALAVFYTRLSCGLLGLLFSAGNLCWVLLFIWGLAVGRTYA